MTMIKTFPAIDMTGTGADAGIELGETPFFPGANAIMRFSEPIGGAGVITLQGSATGVTSPDSYTTTVRTINAAQSAGLCVEVSDLPAFIRVNVTTAGTGTPTCTLEGVQ